MATKLNIKRKDKFIGEETVFQLLNDYINDSYSGKRLKSNGQRITHGTVRNYEYLRQNLLSYCEKASAELKIYIVSNLNQTERERAGKYYRRLYKSFTDHLYTKKEHYDNYVGLIIKCLKGFFNYLDKERNIPIGSYHRTFYVPVEEIPIVALNQEQLSFFIYNDAFDQSARENDLGKIKDIFVFGCTVALRVSDLLSLTVKNLVVRQDKYYINVKSQKTGTYTSIKLPDYAIDILNKYKRRGANARLLPDISSAWFNKRLKELAALLPDDFEMVKTRERRGKEVIVYKDPEKRQHYKLSDHISTHTMRRTAITNMLCLGMPEHLVRKISGHAAGSKEFFRYVQHSQSFIDEETDQFFERIKNLI